MHKKTIVLSTFEDVTEFVSVSEKCSFPINFIRSGDVSAFDGKSFLSVVILLGWNIQVEYDGEDPALEAVLMKHRMTSLNMGWNDYVMKQRFPDALCTGLTEIDAEHKMLVQNFNYFADACDLGNIHQVETIFGFLKEFVLNHFQSEISLQEKAGYPELEAHKLEHAKLHDKVVYLENEIRYINLQHLSAFIYEDLFPAFFDHTLKDDVTFCKYILQHSCNGD